MLEAGSGTSTLIAGRYFRDRGEGCVVALESDASIAAETRAHADAMGLGDHLLVIDAPLDLEPYPAHPGWYRIPEDVLTERGPFGLLFVDGPFGGGGAPWSARTPALPVLERWLTPDAVVLVDDTNRPPERRMVGHWLRTRPGWSSTVVPTVRGLHVLERRPAAD
jgi:predicted O-methyltransferase YrrM